MVRAKIGKMDLGEVQANQTTLINTVKKQVEGAVDHLGIEVTRAEIVPASAVDAFGDAFKLLKGRL